MLTLSVLRVLDLCPRLRPAAEADAARVVLDCWRQLTGGGGGGGALARTDPRRLMALAKVAAQLWRQELEGLPSAAKMEEGMLKILVRDL